MNYYLKKRVITNLLSTGLLTKIFTMQAFGEKKFGLTSNQFLVLGFIVNNDGLYQRQISALLLKDRPNVTRIINILEEKDLVKRVEDVENRKVYKIYATEKGIEAHKHMEPTMISIRKEITKGITNEEIELWIGVMEKIQNNLKEKVKIQI